MKKTDAMYDQVKLAFDVVTALQAADRSHPVEIGYFIENYTGKRFDPQEREAIWRVLATLAAKYLVEHEHTRDLLDQFKAAFLDANSRA